jgi:hypothetical protein
MPLGFSLVQIARCMVFLPPPPPTPYCSRAGVMRDYYNNTQFDMTVGMAAGPWGSPDRFGGTEPGQPAVNGSWERTIGIHRSIAQCSGFGFGRLYVCSRVAIGLHFGFVVEAWYIV